MVRGAPAASSLSTSSWRRSSGTSEDAGTTQDRVVVGRAGMNASEDGANPLEVALIGARIVSDGARDQSDSPEQACVDAAEAGRGGHPALARSRVVLREQGGDLRRHG